MESGWRGSCEDCNSWEFEDSGYGHCGLNALGCADSIDKKGYPTRFLSRDDVVELNRTKKEATNGILHRGSGES